MMSVVCDGRTELPAGVRREYSSYCGNYTYDGERLVTRVDAASDPTRIGSDQVRGVRFEGKRMVLIPPPRLTEADLERPMAIVEVASIKAAPPFSSSPPALRRIRWKAT